MKTKKTKNSLIIKFDILTRLEIVRLLENEIKKNNELLKVFTMKNLVKTYTEKNQELQQKIDTLKMLDKMTYDIKIIGKLNYETRTNGGK
jgi:hypothetical protein